MRTVKRNTPNINSKKKEALDALCCAYAKEKQSWVQRFQAWDLQAYLGRPKTLRDKMVEQKYRSPFGLQARHWKLALEDAAETWDKYWQVTLVTARRKISTKGFSEQDRHYAYWLLKNYPAFALLMKGKCPRPEFPIEESARRQVAGYVRRVVRKYRGKSPTVKKARSVRFDANCYNVFVHNGRQYIKLMSLTFGKRIILPLSGRTPISGTITLVASNGEMHLHVSQELKKKRSLQGPLEAVDFGYTEVMTDTQEMRYGTHFGHTLNHASEALHQKMRKRHKLHAIEKAKKSSDQAAAKKLRKYNLGKKKQHLATKRLKSTLEKEINTGINQLIKTKSPSVLVTEDLRHIFTYNKPKEVNRKLSSWCRGTIQDRIAFKALAEGFRHEQVNPAYGSQSCPHCEFVDHRNRKGDRFQCLHCRYAAPSDQVAAINYARRVGDPQIERYTPYREVKTILLSRFHRRLEAEQSATVPGRTLDTVSEACPPFHSRPHVTAGRGKPRKPGGQSESETKNKHVYTRF